MHYESTNLQTNFENRCINSNVLVLRVFQQKFFRDKRTFEMVSGSKISSVGPTEWGAETICRSSNYCIEASVTHLFFYQESIKANSVLSLVLIDL